MIFSRFSPLSHGLPSVEKEHKSNVGFAAKGDGFQFAKKEDALRMSYREKERKKELEASYYL